MNFFDYNSVGAYFITICTQNKEILLSEIILKDSFVGTDVPTRQHSTVSRFVSTFKRFCNKEYGKNVWQARSFDHIIRDNKDYELHIKYICENPLKWYLNGENHDDITLYE